MKRLSILVMTALMALFLTACGDNVEKKVESAADTAMEAPKADDTAKPAEEAPAPAAEEAKPADQPAQ